MRPLQAASYSSRAQQRFQILETIFKQIGTEKSNLILMFYRGYRTTDIAKALDLPEAIATDQLLEAQRHVRSLIEAHYTYQ